MRCELLLIVGVVAGMASSPTVAQEASVSETRCWVGDVAFSPGMGLNVGEGVAVCEVGSGWKSVDVKGPVAGCLLEGELSSIGAVVSIRNNDDLVLQCEAGGQWAIIEAS